MKMIIIFYIQVIESYPDSKVHGANMGPTWVLPVPDGPHVGLMNLAIWVDTPFSELPSCECTVYRSRT